MASGTSFAGGDNVGGTGSKKIVVNDPKLEIQKSVDKLEYKVGDEVTYKVKVKSLVPGTTLKNVNIEEIIPKGLDLKEDSAKISINGRTLDSGLVKTKDGDITKVTAGLTTINRKWWDNINIQIYSKRWLWKYKSKTNNKGNRR